MNYYSDEDSYKPKFYSYSFKILDDRMRKRRDDQWKRFRLLYLIVLFVIFGFTFGWEASHKFLTFLRYKSPFLVQGCFCNDENFCFAGLNETGAPKYGKPFDCSLYFDLKQLNLLGFLNGENVVENEITKMKKTPIIVTNVDAGSYSNLEGFIVSVGRFYDNSTIVVYDFGMEQKQIDEMKIKWCDVIIEQINKTNYTNKPLLGTQSIVLIDAFTRYKSFIYLRSNLKIHRPFVEEFVKNVIFNQTFPILPIKMGKSVEVVVFDSNDYLPVANVFQNQRNEQTVGFFVSNSKFTRKAFKWLYLCLQTKECIKFVDPLKNNHFDTNSQILWQYTMSQFFGKKHLVFKYFKEDWTQLTPNLINTTLHLYNNRVFEMYKPFSI